MKHPKGEMRLGIYSALEPEEVQLSKEYTAQIKRQVAVYKTEEGRWRCEGVKQSYGEYITEDAPTPRAAAQAWERRWCFLERMADPKHIQRRQRRPSVK